MAEPTPDVPSLGLSELDFDTDDLPLLKAGVPCPVTWCTAHVLRSAACGDPEGPFVGVHVGRVNRYRNGRWATTTQRTLEKMLEAPVSPEMVMAVVAIEDGLNCGLVVGPLTKAQRRQARARRALTPLINKSAEQT